jgi:alpha-ketoglutarate-dependent taurine dioxygenase
MSAFDLDDPAGYARWRDRKLAAYPTRLEDLVVEVRDPGALSDAEHAALLERIRRCNLAVYASPIGGDPDKGRIRRLGERFGLHRLDHNLGADSDAITALELADDALHAGYIPYSNRPIAWHTDGYYNTGADQIRGLLLHCVRPAQDGGANRLLDHELAYLLLRERDPAHIRALARADAMCIPANVVDGREIRPEACGPVFSTDPTGRLHMRYTARRRNIRWRADPDTQAAVAALAEILDAPLPYRFETTLQSGQGLVCNNVLHTRSGFEPDSRRLLYRARYFDRIAAT